MEYAIIFFDDILIKSENVDQHKMHIRAVFQRIEENVFNLGAEKCEFFMKNMKYFGQIIDSDGRKLDPERAEAIKNMPAPDNVAKFLVFLGLGSYYSIYIPKMYDMRGPLDNVVKKGAKWIWSKEYEHAFKKIKSCLLADLSFVHFYLKRKIIVVSDASDYGVVVVLLHKFEDGSTMPTAHASRMLLLTEQSYSQIKKGSLAIIYVVKEFHRFLYGREFTLQTDHKLLLTIFGLKKDIPTHMALGCYSIELQF